jgi:hypothetical protein
VSAAGLVDPDPVPGRIAEGAVACAVGLVHRLLDHFAAGRRHVAEICFAVGGWSLGAFSSRFTDLVGVSPSTYRRRLVLVTTNVDGVFDL